MVVAEGGLLESYGQEEVFFKSEPEFSKNFSEAFVDRDQKLDPTQIRNGWNKFICTVLIIYIHEFPRLRTVEKVRIANILF